MIHHSSSSAFRFGLGLATLSTTLPIISPFIFVSTWHPPPPLFSQNGYSHFFCNKKNCDVAKFLLFHVHAREKEKKMLSVCFYLVWLSPSPTLFMCVYEQVRRGWPHPPSDQYSFLLFSLSLCVRRTFLFSIPQFSGTMAKKWRGGGRSIRWSIKKKKKSFVTLDMSFCVVALDVRMEGVDVEHDVVHQFDFCWSLFYLIWFYLLFFFFIVICVLMWYWICWWWIYFYDDEIQELTKRSVSKATRPAKITSGYCSRMENSSSSVPG